MTQQANARSPAVTKVTVKMTTRIAALADGLLKGFSALRRGGAEDVIIGIPLGLRMFCLDALPAANLIPLILLIVIDITETNILVVHALGENERSPKNAVPTKVANKNHCPRNRYRRFCQAAPDIPLDI